MSIIVYSTPTCPFCKQLKTFLNKHEISFSEIDVSLDQEKATEMINKSGQMGVPVTDIDGQIVIGFDQQKIEEILKI